MAFSQLDSEFKAKLSLRGVEIETSVIGVHSTTQAAIKDLAQVPAYKVLSYHNMVITENPSTESMRILL
ncbi:hypothetical protein RRG08_013133 [Elysia crispata]|uniref:Uncharacterized protein n=1 Tax=Elysia crispata TaxID=231223 RepID=A0AAE1A022_9GAST|nr:hypothetical protein RRG08_013133 [Elysia crispata]